MCQARIIWYDFSSSYFLCTPKKYGVILKTSYLGILACSHATLITCCCLTQQDVIVLTNASSSTMALWESIEDHAMLFRTTLGQFTQQMPCSCSHPWQYLENTLLAGVGLHVDACQSRPITPIRAGNENTMIISIE